MNNHDLTEEVLCIFADRGKLSKKRRRDENSTIFTKMLLNNLLKERFLMGWGGVGAITGPIKSLLKVNIVEEIKLLV